jgi:hypothetical protein
MKRMLGISAVSLCALALAGTATARLGPTGLENAFEGRVERDLLTYFGFDLDRNRGSLKVARFQAQIRYACTDGAAGPAAALVRGKLPVDGDRFAGTLKARTRVASRGGRPGRVKYRIRGKFQSNRKAKGTVDAEIRFRPSEMRGGELVRCYSGQVDWKARRGADVEPVFPMR